jgi:hypothetical protein
MSVTENTRAHLYTIGENALTEAPGGYRLTSYDPDFERQMKLAEEIMHDDRDVLRALSK